MIRELPKITYNGRRYYVDFRLGELRSVTTAQPIRFVDIPAGKYSRFKRKLRELRARTGRQVYMRGVDD